MNLWVQKLISKLIIVPAMLSFVFTCCHPMSVQAAEVKGVDQQDHAQLVSHASDLEIHDAHHCDHEKKIQDQSAIQISSQKISFDLSFNTQSPLTFTLTNPRTDLGIAVRAPITGPPWVGKHIKGFLGVYRS